MLGDLPAITFMSRCSQCGLLQWDDLRPYLDAHDPAMRETLHFLQTIDFSDSDARFIAIHCAVQALDFIAQVDSPELRFEEVEYSELLAKEHSCPFFVVRQPQIPFNQYYNHYLRILQNRAMSNIVITGTVVGSAIGGSHNTVRAYVNDLAIGTSQTSEERALKQELVRLRQAIEDASDLPPANRVAATSDLTALTGELTKPDSPDRQSALQLFWTRLKDSVTASAALTTIVFNIGRIFGYIH